jgi:hypothetical protein
MTLASSTIYEKATGSYIPKDRLRDFGQYKFNVNLTVTPLYQQHPATDIVRLEHRVHARLG